MSTPVLQATQVVKTFPGSVHALAGVDLAVEPGETRVLVGESGSGKSTLLRMFNRMIEPTQGTIRIRDRDAGEWDPIELRRSIGYVQQEGGLLPHWTVAENISLVPRLLGWDADKKSRQLKTLIELVGLDPLRHRDRYPIELSGGQRQRVAIARALAANPDILLLDEPFGALDAITRVGMHTQFLELKGILKKTMVLVTHDLGEAFHLGDRISVMKDGQVLQTGTPGELESNPAHRYVRDLLDHRAEVAT